MGPSSSINSKPMDKVINSISALLFLIVLVGGLIGFGWSWAQQETSKLTVKTLNSEIAKTPVPLIGNQVGRGMRWLIFSELGADVEQGCDGWLFLTDERRLNNFAAKNQQQRLDKIKLISDSLKQKNIYLIVAFIPDKSRIQHDQLCGLSRPHELDPRVANWVNWLEKQKVNAIDLTPFMLNEVHNSPLYFATDTHWNLRGAQIAAIALAERAHKLPVDIRPEVKYERIAVKEEQGYQGDLLKLAGIDTLPHWVTSSLSENRMHAAFIEKQGESTAGGDLFGDSELPNTFLLGTSFSKNSHFIDFLQKQLETVVPNLGIEGGGFWRAASQYLSSDAFLKTPPRLIIWEIPERVMQAPIDPDELLWLKKTSH